MKRFASLYLFALVCIWPIAAFAADADADVGKVIVSHPVVSVLAVFFPIVIRVLREDVTGLPSPTAGVRLLILAGLSLISAGIDQLQHNWNIVAAITAALVTAGPAFFVEVMNMIFGKRATALIKADNAAKAAAVLIFALGMPSLLVQGCTAQQAQAIAPIIDQIVADAQDAASVIDAIDVAARFLFVAKPNPEAEAKFLRYEADARTALDALRESAKGAKNLGEEQSAPAFASFQKAFDDFESLAKEIGVVPVTASSTKSLARSFRRPLLLKGKA